MIPFYVIGQELPPVTNFSPNDYVAGNQNWMISQGKDDNFYFANGSGLLEYNGERWKLYPVPNNSIVRCVKAYKNRIYTGAYMDAGYWVRDKYGDLEYTSIINKFPHGVGDGELFWDIYTLEDVVVFRSFSGIYFYYQSTNKVVELPIPEGKTVSGLFKVNKNIYFQLVGGGLYTITKGEPELKIPYSQLTDVTIKHLYEKGNELRLITGHSGFFKWDGSMLNEFNKKFSEQINYTNIFSAANLPNGELILGTVGKGILQINAEGELMHAYNQENVLLNNTALSLFVDNENTIWAGLDYGISQIIPNSPFRSFRDVSGEIGSVYASYLNNGNLYLGTNQGLYLKEKGKQGFNLIPGTNGQVWSLNEIDGQLFCGHDTGTFLIKGNQAIKICDRLGTWFVKKIKPNTYVQGHYYGFSFLKKVKGKYVALPLVKDFQHSSRNIEIASDSALWVNNEHKGVFKVKYNDSLNKIEKLQNYTFSDSIWATSSMFKYLDTLYYSTKTKIYQYNSSANKFSEENRLNSLVSKVKRISGKMLALDNQKLWGFANNYIFYLKPSTIKNDYELKRFYIDESFRNIAEGYENISKINESQYFLGTANGYLLFQEYTENTNNYSVQINQVQYSKLDEKPQKSSLREKGSFDFKQNNIFFQFSAPVYNKYVKVLYSYRLLGLSSKWSEYHKKADANFKNLAFGNYTFEVRAKLANEVTTSPARYTFTISRPNYLSRLAIAGYLILLCFVFLVVHFLYRRHHKKVIAENEKTLKMKNLEAEQEIIKLKNEKLEQDMENKSRELAVSTMSLIKKNEFLTSIKNRLSDTDDSIKVRSVIKTIDKDINEVDNWNFFKKAFSNADKEFFNKVKAKHPDLTSNDLKLCAYLRLNLSSKEIAPLLNISVKSVEIKRYRLRKKMNLDRETNLTNYILEI